MYDIADRFTYLGDKEEGPVQFAIVLPAHCAPHHIGLMLDTLKENTLYRHELLMCADKATTEVRQAIVERGIVPIELEFGHVYHVYDWGAAAAISDWICWACDDTVHGPGWDKRLMDLIENENDYPGLFTMQPPQTGNWYCALHSVDLGLDPREFSREAFAKATLEYASPNLHTFAETNQVSIGPPHVCHKSMWQRAHGFLKDGGAFPQPLDLGFVGRCLALGARKRTAADVFVYHYGNTTTLTKTGAIKEWMPDL